jgi:hypothetical protein
VSTGSGVQGGRIDLRDCPLLGHVTQIDRNRLTVELSDPELVSRLSVSDLVALPAADVFLIGLLEAMAATNGSSVELRVMPIGTLRSSADDISDAFSRGILAYPHVGGDCHLLDGDALEGFMRVIAEEVAADEGLLLGRHSSGHTAIADGNRLFQRHMALLGSTGAGKSWAVALMLERAAELAHANMVVFDLHGEYWPLTEHRAGEQPIAHGLRIAGPGDQASRDPDLLYLPYWLLEQNELMSVLLDPNDPHASDALFRMTEHVLSLKHNSLLDAGRDDALATFTIDSPIPYRLDNLIQLLKRDDTEQILQPPANRVVPGPFAGRLTGFIARLEARAADPRYGFIFNPPPETLSYEWLTHTATRLLEAGPGETGIKIIDLSEAPSAVVPLVAGVLARLVYNVQFWMSPVKRTPVCLVCDEAHLYLPSLETASTIHRAALHSFEAIAKEGRKYGVGLVVVSQRPADVSGTILSQCNNFVIMRLTNDWDQSMVERLVPQNLTGVVGMLPALEPGEAILVGDALLLPTRIKFDPPSSQPASATQAYWSLWRDKASSREAIAAGVDALQTQLRPAR